MNSGFSTYLQLGFEHISDLNGYDHILFIVALCAIYQLKEWKRVAILVTAFTIGHSITLALAALDVIKLPTNWIEFLIPVTIFLTALYNILWAKRSREIYQNKVHLNYFLALLFGLIHGMGFSNFFRATLLPGEEQQLVMQLLAFNVGVELGQLLIVAIVLVASFFVFNVFNLKKQIWNWLISGIAGAMALFMAWERSAALFA